LRFCFDFDAPPKNLAIEYFNGKLLPSSWHNITPEEINSQLKMSFNS